MEPPCFSCPGQHCRPSQDRGDPKLLSATARLFLCSSLALPQQQAPTPFSYYISLHTSDDPSSSFPGPSSQQASASSLLPPTSPSIPGYQTDMAPCSSFPLCVPALYPTSTSSACPSRPVLRLLLLSSCLCSLL